MSDALSHYHDRRPVDGDRMSRHSRRARKVKHILIGLVGLLVVAMVVWPLTNLGKRTLKVNLASQATQASDEKPVMLKPRLHGMDADRQPYNVTATQAIQEDNNNVILQDVVGDIALKGNGWVALHADTGHYHVRDKTLQLLGSVNLLTDSGYELNTETAHVLLGVKEIKGDATVSLQGPLGTLTANEFNLQGDANTLIFKGDVHLTVHPKAGKKK